MTKASKVPTLLIALASIIGLVAGYVVFDKQLIRSWGSHIEQPNFLFILTDDQTWLHTSYAGYPAIRTPNFDRIAREGIYFENAYASAPTCTASRSAILTGQHFWRLGSAAQLWGEFPASLINYQHILASNGYKIGYTGKGWGPGRALEENPAGPDFNDARLAVIDPNLSPFDFAANFQRFMSERKPGQPFSYWLTPLEPHRPFHLNLGRDSGTIDMDMVQVPPFLPDIPEVRGDIADYLYEIQWFDDKLGTVLKILADSGELDNTVIVFSSDNGMSFPRSKSNNYEYGTHIPLAVRWGKNITQHEDVSDFISLTDIAPTFLDLANIPIPSEMTGKSFRAQLFAKQSGWIDTKRNFAYSGFERHIKDSRLDNRGYPSRAIHTDTYLYIKNMAPDRWPAGRPPAFGDIDDGSPTKNALIADRRQYEQAWQQANNKETQTVYATSKSPDQNIDLIQNPGYALVLAAEKRPAEELYAIKRDPGQLHNLADDPAYDSIKKKLSQQLAQEMKDSGDPWASGNGAIFDTYKYYANDKATTSPTTE
jgi:uncharacterized sulfatase